MSKKDMRRPDLVVPYLDPVVKNDNTDIMSTFTSTLPMAAIFTRSKMIGWASVTMATQSWLAETSDSKKSAATPAIFSVGMSLMSLGVAYMQMFMPPTAVPGSQAAAAAGTANLS